MGGDTNPILPLNFKLSLKASTFMCLRNFMFLMRHCHWSLPCSREQKDWGELSSLCIFSIQKKLGFRKARKKRQDNLVWLQRFSQHVPHLGLLSILFVLPTIAILSVLGNFSATTLHQVVVIITTPIPSLNSDSFATFGISNLLGPIPQSPLSLAPHY
jgi:hypothetical protein